MKIHPNSLKNLKNGKRFQKGQKTRLGSHPSEQTKQILSDKLKIIAKEKGFGKWMKGKKQSKITKQKKREASLRAGNMPPHFKGNKASHWKGGITPIQTKVRNSLEFKLWREAVFARDNWTCQKTGIRGGKLHAHHIRNFADYPELRLSIDNGITLSDESHKLFHKIYGKKKNTPEQLKDFLRGYYDYNHA